MLKKLQALYWIIVIVDKLINLDIHLFILIIKIHIS